MAEEQEPTGAEGDISPAEKISIVNYTMLKLQRGGKLTFYSEALKLRALVATLMQAEQSSLLQGIEGLSATAQEQIFAQYESAVAAHGEEAFTPLTMDGYMRLMALATKGLRQSSAELKIQHQLH